MDKPARIRSTETLAACEELVVDLVAEEYSELAVRQLRSLDRLRSVASVLSELADQAERAPAVGRAAIAALPGITPGTVARTLDWALLEISAAYDALVEQQALHV